MKEEVIVYNNDESSTPVVNDLGAKIKPSAQADGFSEQADVTPITPDFSPKGLDGEVVIKDLPKEDDKEAAFLKRLLEEEVTIQAALDEENNYSAAEQKEPYAEESLIEPPDINNGALSRIEYSAMDPELGAKLIADAELAINDITKKKTNSVQHDAVLDTDKIEKELEELLGFESTSAVVSDRVDSYTPSPLDIPELMDDLLIE